MPFLLPSNDLCPSNSENYANVYKSLGHAFLCVAVVKTQKKSCQVTSHLSALTGNICSCLTKPSSPEGVVNITG